MPSDWSLPLRSGLTAACPLFPGRRLEPAVLAGPALGLRAGRVFTSWSSGTLPFPAGSGRRRLKCEIRISRSAFSPPSVRRLWNPLDGSFAYRNYGDWESHENITSRGLTGAGILSLALSGLHQTPMALAAGDWLLAHPFRYYGELVTPRDNFFYSAYYCSQAMAQLGGRYWDRFFPSLVSVLLSNQSSDGSWHARAGWSGGHEAMFGDAYTTSLAILSLTPPYQLLPVYQR